MKELGLASFAAEEEIDIGMIEGFFQELPEKAWHLGMRVVMSAIVLLIGVQIVRIIRGLVKKSLAKGNADQGVIQFIDSFLKFSLYVVLFITIASGFGMDAASILALLGSAGVAIGLAIQGSLANFVGGVLILLLKPFKVGDYIVTANGNEGAVQEIQIFYTKLTTGDNRLVIIPNGDLSNSSMINVSAMPNRRVDISVGISYQADIRQAREVLLKLLESDDKVLADMDKKVYVDSLADSAVVLGIRFYVLSEDYWESKWRLTEAVKYALDEADISIPYNQLDVHLNPQG